MRREERVTECHTGGLEPKSLSSINCPNQYAPSPPSPGRAQPPFAGGVGEGAGWAVRPSVSSTRCPPRPAPNQVCWPALSSASAERAVAQAFVKNDEGSLFFVQSTGGRAISRFSKYPDEAEVLAHIPRPPLCPVPRHASLPGPDPPSCCPTEQPLSVRPQRLTLH